MNALMYHDVVAADARDASGFPGRDAARYKVTPELFAAHVDVIRESMASAHPTAQRFFTFDDGGVSALVAADLLEARGFTGQFFVTTNYIGTRGFLTERQIRELAHRGHIVGSHSCSHPLRMGRCPWPQLIDEWTRQSGRPGGHSRHGGRGCVGSGRRLFTPGGRGRIPRRHHDVVHLRAHRPVASRVRPDPCRTVHDSQIDNRANGSGARTQRLVGLHTAGGRLEREEIVEATRRRALSARASPPARLQPRGALGRSTVAPTVTTIHNPRAVESICQNQSSHVDCSGRAE